MSLPHSESNMYTAILYDLSGKVPKPVEVTVDERLCSTPDGRLLGATPSPTGELWVCYLEKAIAAHCGGWDKINGGQCTHGWQLLTGAREQYQISYSEEDGGYRPYGTFNPNTKEWEQLANSPSEGFQGAWPMDWPEVGGGGDKHMAISKNDLFERMCHWEDANYLIAAGTRAGSDKEDTDGIVDGHAYSVLHCVNDVAGTDIDLIKVRNPWGHGEFKDGKWDDDGPGWKEYPQIKEELQPVSLDDGIFWVDQEEFFKYFGTVYLCAHDMCQLGWGARQEECPFGGSKRTGK